MQSIVFYDDLCGLCQKSILFFLKHDKKHMLSFAPLSGSTFQKELSAWKELNPTVESVVLLEIDESGEKKIYYYSQAVFRLLWKIGGLYKIFGLLSFLPRWLLIPSDEVYKMVMRRRKSICKLSDVNIFQAYKDRFLK